MFNKNKKPDYYKCDVCGKATQSVTLLPIKGAMTFFTGKSSYVICDNCFHTIMSEARDKIVNKEKRDD